MTAQKYNYEPRASLFPSLSAFPPPRTTLEAKDPLLYNLVNIVEKPTTKSFEIGASAKNIIGYVMQHGPPYPPQHFAFDENLS